jgi:hypothetical protein
MLQLKNRMLIMRCDVSLLKWVAIAYQVKEMDMLLLQQRAVVKENAQLEYQTHTTPNKDSNFSTYLEDASDHSYNKKFEEVTSKRQKHNLIEVIAPTEWYFSQKLVPKEIQDCSCWARYDLLTR